MATTEAKLDEALRIVGEIRQKLEMMPRSDGYRRTIMVGVIIYMAAMSLLVYALTL